MNKDIFSDLQATSQKLAAVLLGQLEEARQKELQELNKQRDALHKKRLAIESQLSDLQRQHSDLSSEIDQLNGNIRQVESYDIRSGILGGGVPQAPAEPAPAPPAPPANGSAKKSGRAAVEEAPPKSEEPKPLRTYVLEVLTEENRPMNLAQIAEAVLAAGYPTQAKNFPASLKSLLYDMKKREQINHDKSGFSI